MTVLDSSPAAAAVPSRAAFAAAGPVRGDDSPSPRRGLPRDPRERLADLFDPGTLELLPAGEDDRSGVVAGAGLVHGAGAVAFASDPRVQGGAMGSAGCAAIVAAYSEAVSRGVPIVGLWHSGGARLAEGVASLHAVEQSSRR